MIPDISSFSTPKLPPIPPPPLFWVKSAPEDSSEAQLQSTVLNLESRFWYTTLGPVRKLVDFKYRRDRPKFT